MQSLRRIDILAFNIFSTLSYAFYVFLFSYTQTNFKIVSHYRKFSPHIQKFLVDWPTDLVKCLAKMTSANIMDPSKISITVLVFSELNFQSGLKESYLVTVENDNAMPRGTCWDCQSSSYPCKYFFAKFRKFQVWQRDTLLKPWWN